MSGTEVTEGGEESFDEPAYATDEKTKPGFVRAIVAVKGLKISSQMTLKGMKKKATNADVECTFEQESFCLTAVGNRGDLKHKKYQLKIRKLPGEIIPESSKIELEKDRILVFLAKKESKSWYPELEDGLETAEEPDEDENS